ncbi:MAG: CHC2 zinc finger domain-containing protein, partial [Alphaproteobacteria bacterium]
MATIPPAFLDEIRTRLDLSDIVGKRVKLQRKGREWTACCPFHNEKTPSFYVNNEKGFYHCFGCGEHGDHIGFVMNHDGQTFIEAVETLANEAGLDMPKADPDAARKAERAKGLKEALEAAVRAYQEALFSPEGETARAYIEKRGLSAETVQRFGLGYSPDARDWLFKKLTAQGFPAQVLIDAALAKAP